MSSLKPNCIKLLLHLITTVWKTWNPEFLVCLPQLCHWAACQPIFSQEFTVYLVKISLHKYFLFQFCAIFFSLFPFLNPVSQTEKPILAWHIKNNSTDVAPITVCFLFLHKNRKLTKKVSLCWSSLNPSTINAFLRVHLLPRQPHCKPAIVKILNYFIPCHFYTLPLSGQTVQLLFCFFFSVTV